LWPASASWQKAVRVTPPD